MRRSDTQNKFIEVLINGKHNTNMWPLPSPEHLPTFRIPLERAQPAPLEVGPPYGSIMLTTMTATFLTIILASC